jgi:hypothetical protein
MDRSDQEALELVRGGAKRVWPGCYRGRVESIDDPDRLGRVRVRVWALHSDETVVPDSSLPWAEVNEDGGGGFDFGSFDPPPVGASVWVMFEGGDSDLPVVIGTFRGIPKRDSINPNIFLVKDQKPNVETAWKPPDEELETPKDVFDEVYAGDPHPTRRVWKKSYKGHTILIEDGDGKEFLRIVDRAGQVIEMDCPVDEEYSKGNAAQRGARDAIRGDQLPHNIMRNKRASIRIRDLSGQEILLDARHLDERVIIRGKSRTGAENQIILRSGKGKESIELRDSAGDYILLDPNSETPIRLQDSAGNGIKFEKGSGGVVISSAKVTTEEAPQKKTTIKGTKESDIRGDEVKQVQGNKKTQVVNDASVGVLGNTSLSLGGALKVVVANTSPSGPETTPLDIQLLTGNFHLNIKTLGNITLDTTSGNVELSTLAGNATLKTSSIGNANVDATVGKVLLGNALLPTALGSMEQLVKGNTFQTQMATYLSARQAATGAVLGTCSAFQALLVPGLVLNLIPAIGNTLFSVLAGPAWIAHQAGLVAAFSAYQGAESALNAALISMLSLKTYTQ